MAENQLLPFANGDTANVIPFADWSGLSVRLTGFQSGIASSQQFNYILGQGGAAGYVIGQFVADFTSDNATINATALYASFKKAIAAFVPGNIADGSIGSSKIANGAITNAKLANDAVTGAKLADNSVGTEHIQSNAVTADEIAAGAVGTSELANGSVTFPKIASAAIATQSQAEAGTASNVLMTPQRVKQAIDSAFESDLPMASATQLGGVKITGDDGITINGSGEIAVDFSQMPTDKFEDLLKSIRVPIWLTANKSFYVNGETGSDTLDDGRGETSSKPFKTIQACVKYVTENYNIVSYSVTIYVAQGIYNELLTLSDYSRTTGRILIRAQEGQTVKVTNPSNSGNCVRCLAGLWYLQDIDSDLSITSANASGGAYFTCPVIASGNSATLYVVNCDLTVNLTVEPQNWIGIICSTAGASVYIDDQSVHSLVNGANYPGKYMFELYSTSSGTIALMAGTTSEQNSITLSGSFYCVAYASDATIRLTTGNNSVPMQFVDSGVTGMRYSASNGGRIITQGAGPEYFPGTTAGTVSSSTYSFYS